MLYGEYHDDQRNEECYDELLNLFSAAGLHRVSAHQKHHQHHPYGCRSTNVHFIPNFLPRIVRLWNDLPSPAYPSNFDKEVFDKRVYSYLKIDNVLVTTLGLWMFMSSGDHLLSDVPCVHLPLINPKTKLRITRFLIPVQPLVKYNL
ncbi:hypothetical protein EVAR_64441_1 [Eumeta japonica]|uniref:Uncharacterized protein n=1 Tax=Eumeta variegata TaxID=151549 RepID=A0A4C1YNX7_EUMVA|nr:hypothetical protein EVAR_64441_1 [Eumeta japonica]